MNGARKFDDDKLPVMTGCFLRFPRAMKEIARVSKLGADKYEVVLPDDNFLNVPNGVARYTDAMGRHALDEVLYGPVNRERGGNLPEAGVDVLHAAQIAWNALTRLELMLVEQEKQGSIELNLKLLEEIDEILKDMAWKS